MGPALKVSPEIRETMLFSRLCQALTTKESTEEALLELRDLSGDDNRRRIVGDLQAYIKTAREDLAAVDALLEEEES